MVYFWASNLFCMNLSICQIQLFIFHFSIQLLKNDLNYLQEQITKTVTYFLKDANCKVKIYHKRLLIWGSEKGILCKKDAIM